MAEAILDIRICPPMTDAELGEVRSMLRDAHGSEDLNAKLFTAVGSAEQTIEGVAPESGTACAFLQIAGQTDLGKTAFEKRARDWIAALESHFGLESAAVAFVDVAESAEGAAMVVSPTVLAIAGVAVVGVGAFVFLRKRQGLSLPPEKHLELARVDHDTAVEHLRSAESGPCPQRVTNLVHSWGAIQRKAAHLASIALSDERNDPDFRKELKRTHELFSRSKKAWEATQRACTVRR